MITSTSMDPSHTEVVTISNVDNKVITFTPSLQHRHLGKILPFIHIRLSLQYQRLFVGSRYYVCFYKTNGKVEVIVMHAQYR